LSLRKANENFEYIIYYESCKLE